MKFIGYGKFSLGSRSFIGHYTKVYLGVAEVVVGEDVDIGPEVSILTGSHKIGSAERIAGEGYAKNVSIGDGSWIGARSVILPGVTIGRGCMVAAGSVVINDVPDNTMVAGVPAKLVRQLGGSEI